MTVFRPQRKTRTTPSWYYRFRADGATYERGGYPTKKQAQAGEWQRRGEIGARGPQHVPPAGSGPAARLADYADTWLQGLEDSVQRGDLAPRTLQSYRALYDGHILPALGRRPLGSLTRPVLLAFLTTKRDALSKNTVRLLRSALSSLLTDALERGDLTAHPLAAGGRRRRGQRTTEAERVAHVRPMTRDQRDLFLRAAWAGAIDNHHAHTADGGTARLKRGVRGLTNRHAGGVADGPDGGANRRDLGVSRALSDVRGAAPPTVALPPNGSGTPVPLKAKLAPSSEVYPLLFELLAKTGLRPGEAFALQVGDVDLARGALHIERAWDGHAVRPTKTHQRRMVDLTAGLVERLRDRLADGGGPRAIAPASQGRIPGAVTTRGHVDRDNPLNDRQNPGSRSAPPVQHQEGDGADRGGAPLPTNAWLLPNGAGHPLDLRRVRRHFRAALRAAPLPRFRLYDLRHTYATLRLMAGAPLLYVSHQLGHRDMATTARHYATWLPSLDRRWVEEDAIRPGRGGDVGAGARARGPKPA